MNIFNLLKITETTFYFYGSFGSQFIAIPGLFDMGLFLNTSIFSLKNQFNFIFKKLVGLKNGYRVRLKIVGRGFSFFKRKHFVYMNIGRSHIVRFFINSFIRIVCLKKKMTLISKDFDYLRKVSQMLITAQPALIYKAKGLVYELFSYKVKVGKVKQYRV